MNDGVIALLFQWCMICLIWMGVLDKHLPVIGLSRMSALTFLAASLLSSFANWRLYFMPVEINVSGLLLPCLLAAWLWGYLQKEYRHYVLAGSFLCATFLFFIKKMVIWDPILLIANELILIPGVIVLLFFLLTRNPLHQMFLLFLALPMADAFFFLSYLGFVTPITLGAGAAQDMFWSSFVLWIIASVCYQFGRQGLFTLFKLARRKF